MKVAVVKETYPDECRVALTPADVVLLQKLDCEVLIEAGAGLRSGHTDQAYLDKGGTIVDRNAAWAADVLLGVRWAGAGPGNLPAFRSDQVVIGTCDPLSSPQAVASVAESGALLFGLELIPRITRAQSMDVLSSMATVSGYRAVLLAAIELPQMFPLMMTAAGTLSPARALVIGAGVAGLQAIASARRLGAVVHAYDVRPAVREQCESLGAKFVELPLETAGAEGMGGYAQSMGEEFYQRQRALMARVVAESDVVITTAAIPGKPSPLLVTAEAVKAMQPGSVIIDLAAERGGNCELSKPNERVVAHGVTILAPTNLPSEVPRHASQMYSRNIATFLKHLIKDRSIQIDLSDPITGETLLTRDRQVIHPRLRELLQLAPLAPQQGVR